MYIIQNAWKSIVRNKGRNILIGIIALIIALSSCLALSIRQAAETVRTQTLSQMNITAQISFDRSGAMQEMADQMGQPPEQGEAPDAEGGSRRENFDFDALSGEALTLEDYMTYTQALSQGDGYYYTLSTSLNASGDLLPYGESEEDTTDTTDTQTTDTESFRGGPQGQKGPMSAQGDFSLTGFSSYQSMLSLFGEDGTLSVTEGEVFQEETGDATCLISDELALYNDLSVGDTITLSNPNYESETYTLTICGIYTNAASDSGNSMFSFSDPANNIYLSYESLSDLVEASATAGNVTTDDSGNEMDASLRQELSFTYTFSSSEHYQQFSQAVYDLGLSEDYTVSSQDLAAFENSLSPLTSLSSIAWWFFLVVLLVGAIILMTLNAFNLRERKYEIGVLAAIGMKKWKIGTQFVFELFCVTFIAFLIGTTIGACLSVPVTNRLLAEQTASMSSSQSQVAGNFGKEPGQMGDMGGNMGGGMGGRGQQLSGPTSYIDSVTSATDLTVVAQLVGVGILLTILSSGAAILTITRYEPLKILASRS